IAIPGIEKNIRKTLEKAAAQYGEKVAIHFEYDDISFSYSELNKRVNQFANVLRSRGVKKADHVAVMLPNCSEFPLTWLALAKLGAVMVPVNNRYKVKDLEYILNDSDSTALVIHSDYLPTFRELAREKHGIEKVFRVGPGE